MKYETMHEVSTPAFEKQIQCDMQYLDREAAAPRHWYVRRNLLWVLALRRRYNLQLAPTRSDVKLFFIQIASIELLSLLGHASFLVLAPLFLFLLLILGQKRLFFWGLLLVSLLPKLAPDFHRIELC